MIGPFKAIGLYAFLSAVVALVLLPMAAALWGSLQHPITPERTTLSWANYAQILERPGLLRSIVMSLISASSVMVLVVLASSLGAYGLCRFSPPGLKAVLGWLVSLRMFPLLLVLIPLFRFFMQTQLSNTLWGVILAQGAFILPASFWLTLVYFRQIPIEIYEAAEVDGAAPWRVLVRIVFPLVAPGVGVVAFLTFVHAWNDYVIASIVTQSLQVSTLPFTLVNLLNSVQGDQGVILALSCLLAIPPIVLYLLVQRQFHRGWLSTL